MRLSTTLTARQSPRFIRINDPRTWLASAVLLLLVRKVGTRRSWQAIERVMAKRLAVLGHRIGGRLKDVVLRADVSDRGANRRGARSGRYCRGGGTDCVGLVSHRDRVDCDPSCLRAPRPAGDLRSQERLLGRDVAGRCRGGPEDRRQVAGIPSTWTMLWFRKQHELERRH